MLDMLSPKQIQENIRTSARNAWLASLGAVASVEEERSQLFDRLVSRGREVQNRGRDQVRGTIETAENEVESMFERLSSTIERRVTATLERTAISTRGEVRELTRKVERLTELFARMETTELKPARSTGPERKIYHVTPHDDGWKVQAEDAERASRVTETKAEAVTAARELAKNQEPSQVVVHRLDGTIQNHYSYGEDEAA